MADPLDAFPDLSDESDRELVARHQQVVRELEGVTVDGLVYEYRTQFHRDPLVTQDGTAYYLSVRSHVWEEFADRMDLSDDELARLKAIHAEQFAASVGKTTSDGEKRSDGEKVSDGSASEEETSETAMILTKE